LNWKAELPVFAAALWWGSLTAIGFVAVPLLFTHLGTPALAGQVAARLFTAQTWISLGCGVFLLFASRPSHAGAGMGWARGAILFVMAGLLLALLGEFAVAPRIMARADLKFWHGVASVMYVVQWACAAVVLWKVSRLSSGQ
jgi:hypothetical protein